MTKTYNRKHVNSKVLTVPIKFIQTLNTNVG